MNHHLTATLLSYLGPLLVILLVAWRLIKNPPKKVKPNRLFILPLVLALAAFFTLKQSPAPDAVWILIFAAAGVLGAGVGYLNGRHREFSLDNQTGEIMGRATPIGTIIFGALFAARFVLKLAFPELNAGQAFGPSTAAHPAASVIGWTEAGLVFSTAMILVTAITTWVRIRHLVEQRHAPPPDVAKDDPQV
jgi:hypothetical protein